MTSPPAASPFSDYGSDPEWDSSAEAQLVAIELEATESLPPLSSNPGQNSTTTRLGEVRDAAEGEENSKEDGLTAARLAEAVREFGVVGAEDRLDGRSLYERYRLRRGWGALSVSDLSGPSWCEVQHSYRLASKPHLPPLERPPAILSRKGASITVDTARTVGREKILDKGKAVHAKIEREVMGEQEKVEVKVEGKEEWWALRILNTIVCLETLLTTGRVREVPVVGWVNSFLVFGVIDEIERRDFLIHPPPPATPLTPTPNSIAFPSNSSTDSTRTRLSKKTTPPPSPEKNPQLSLKQFFSPVPSPSKKGKERSDGEKTAAGQREQGMSGKQGVGAGTEVLLTRSGLVLSDTKTRFNRSLPAKLESRAARLQLMLYHRLFTSMLLPEQPPPSPPSSSPSTPFSWSRLYAHLSLDPTSPLSPAFLTSIQPILRGFSLDALTSDIALQHFVDLLGRYGELLRGERPPELLLAAEIEISYRMREEQKGGWRGRSSAKREKTEMRLVAEKAAREEREDRAEGVVSEDEEQDLQRAIQLSLQEAAASAPTSALSKQSEESVELRSPLVNANTLDCQLEDSQLPFLANPSLPLPPPVVDAIASIDGINQPSSLSPATDDLPLNSQSHSAESANSAPAVSSSRSTRSSLRIRSTVGDSTSSVSAPALSPATSSAPSPSRKRARSASPSRQLSLPTPTFRPTPSAPPASTSFPAQFTTTTSSTSSAFSSPEPPPDRSFIGVEIFLNSPAELDAWLSSVSAYWRGQREPVGVALEEVNRCRSCEFEEGCEWRAMKAEEAVEEARKRRMEKGRK